MCAMKLSEWLIQNNVSQLVFAQRLGATQQAVSNWLKGTRTPRPRQMQNIIRETSGAGTPNDFLPDIKQTEAAE